jgi:hypothetical protein
MRTGGYYAERGDGLRAADPAASQSAYRRALELLIKAKAIATAQTTGEGDPARFGPLLQRIAELEAGWGMQEAHWRRRWKRVAGTLPARRFTVRWRVRWYSQGRTDEAAAALMEGVIVDGGQWFAPGPAVDVHRGLRPLGLRHDGGARAQGVESGMRDGEAAFVRGGDGHDASAGGDGRQDLADAMRQTALTDFRCKAEELK